MNKNILPYDLKGEERRDRGFPLQDHSARRLEGSMVREGNPNIKKIRSSEKNLRHPGETAE